MAFNGIDYELEILAGVGRFVTAAATVVLITLPSGHLLVNLGVGKALLNICLRTAARCSYRNFRFTSAAAA